MNRTIITLLSLFGLAAIGSTTYLWYENDKMKKSYAELAGHSSSLNEQLNVISTEKDNLSEQNSSLNEENSSLSERNAAKTAELNKAIAAHQQELAALLAEREKQRESLKTQHGEVLSELKKTIDDQRVKISEMNGVIKVKMENKILFPSGQATISEEGKSVLKKVAEGFAKIEDKRFRIEGHTDNIPIHNARFPSNWELSATRAANVLHVMLATGEVDPLLFEIVGLGEYHPLSPNDTNEGRAQNRRIEILLFPKFKVISK